MRAAVPTTTAARIATRITVLMVAVAAGPLLAACSGSGPAASGTPAPGGSAAAGGASGQPAAAGNGTGKATCTQVTKAQVQPLLVKPITNVSSATVPDQISLSGTAQQCTFAVADSAQAIVITVVGAQDADNFFIAARRATSNPAEVSGIGARAVRDADDGTSAITAEDNGVGCSVSTSGEDQLPGVAALEEAAGDTSDIGDKNFAVISTALGTLCNAVFGSGNTTPDFSGLSSAGVGTPDGGGLPTGFGIPTDGSS
jgi:hypothetical protein